MGKDTVNNGKGEIIYRQGSGIQQREFVKNAMVSMIYQKGMCGKPKVVVENAKVTRINAISARENRRVTFIYVSGACRNA